MVYKTSFNQTVDLLYEERSFLVETKNFKRMPSSKENFRKDNHVILFIFQSNFR